MRMHTEAKTKNSIGRLAFAGLSFLLQVMWTVSLGVWLRGYSTAISLIITLVAVIIVMRIFCSNGPAAFKMPWIIVILAFPMLGLCLYFLFGRKDAVKGIRKRFENISPEVLGLLEQKPEVAGELEQQNLGVANQCRYLWNYSHYPVYQNTDVVFYKEASDAFEAQLEELEKAEHYIFMEYHAIEEAGSFARLKDVLTRKASSGVEVRLIYDDVGSISFIDAKFVKRMEEAGVQCRMFNPVTPFFNIFMNNRDHRKITVVDNRVGFTGGYNLADEYFNLVQPYGYWKDTGVKMTGDAVKNLTAMFLEMWNAMKHTDMDYSSFFRANEYVAAGKGFVQPYADTPLDSEYVGENVYLNMIKYAKRYVYIATPYLIISDEMRRELGLAAKRGVDVRIVTPGIPDKKMIYQMTRSYYSGLTGEGVRIYEYTPGFLHAKQVICDGELATVGTINFDFRSLYHHFENGVLFYACDCLRDIHEDFVEIMNVSREVTEEYRSGMRKHMLLGQAILRLFAPLL